MQAGAATLQRCFHGATAELREKVAFEVTANQAAFPCIYIYIYNYNKIKNKIIDLYMDMLVLN